MTSPGWVAWFVLGLPFAAGAAVYLLAPLVVWRSHRQPANNRFEALEATPDDLVEGTEEEVASALQSFVALGFEERPAVIQQNPPPQQRVMVWPLVDRANGDVAYVTVVESMRPRARFAECVAQVVTRFGDESLTTMNPGVLDAFPRPEGWRVQQAPARWNAEALVELHRTARAKDFAHRPAQPIGDDPIGALIEAMGEQLEYGVGRGVVRRVGEDYRLTWKGAFLLTWAQLWPQLGRRRRAIAAAFERDVERLGKEDLPESATVRNGLREGEVGFTLMQPDASVRVSTPLSPGRSLLVTSGGEVVAFADALRSELVIGTDRIRLPGGVEVRPDQVEEATLLRHSTRPTILLRATRDGDVVRADLPASLFADQRTFLRAYDSLRGVIAARPDGAERVLRLEVEARHSASMFLRAPWLTRFVAVAMFAAWQAQESIAGGIAELATLLLGALVPSLVRDGEVHRLLTAHLIQHSGLNFLAMLVGSYVAGAFLERFVGSLRLAVILVCGVAAGWGSLCFEPGAGQWFGASGGLAAYAGALLVVMPLQGYRMSGENHLVDRLAPAAIVVLGVVIVATEWWWLGSWLHVTAGLAGGAVTRVLVWLDGDPDAILEPPRGLTRALGLVAIVLAAASVAASAVQVAEPGASLERAVLVLDAEVNPDDPEILQLVEAIAGWSDSPRALRAAALGVIEGVVARNPDSAQLVESGVRIRETLLTEF